MARFQETVDIQTQSVQSGAAGALLSLADRLESFKQQGFKAAGEQAVARGTATGQAVELQEEGGITQAPAFKEKKFIGSIEINAHNKALRSSYTASLGNDIREETARIKAENPDDVVAFNEAYKGFTKGVLNSVDPSVKNDVALFLDEKGTSARITVQAENVKKDNDIAFGILKESEENSLEASLMAARNGNIEESASELVDHFRIINEQVEAGFISEPEAREKMRDAELAATQESLIGSVRQLTEAGKFAEAFKAVEKMRAAPIKGMTVEETQDIITSITADITTSLNLRNKIEDSEAVAIDIEQKTTYNDSYIGILQGTTTSSDIIRGIRNGTLTESQGTKLINTLNTRGHGVNDWVLISDIETRIRNGEDADDIRNSIITNTGTRLTGAEGSELLSALNESLDAESILHTGTVTRARTFIKNSIRITGVFGSLDPAAEKKLALSTREFDTRVKAGEDPWEVADDLVGKTELNRLPQPMFGTKEDLDRSQELLDQSRLDGTVDADTYNYQTGLIKNIREMQDNIAEFDKNKKEALSGPK